MRTTNRASLPPAATASVVAASLALGTSVPTSRSRTGDPLPCAKADRRLADPSGDRRDGHHLVEREMLERDERSHQLRDARHRAPRASASRAASVCPSTEALDDVRTRLHGGTAPCADPQTRSAATARARPRRNTVRKCSRRRHAGAVAGLTTPPPPRPRPRAARPRRPQPHASRPAGLAVRVDHRPGRVDERARRAARERPRDVGGRRALRPDTRQKDDRARHLAPRVADVRGTVAPTTAPTLDRPRAPTRSWPHSSTSCATWRQTGRPSESSVLDVRAPAFDVRTRRKARRRRVGTPRGTGRASRDRGTG